MYGIWNRLQYMLSPQFDIYEQISYVVNGKVLDVGCGSGFGTHLFTRQAKSVKGIDLDEDAINFDDYAWWATIDRKLAKIFPVKIFSEESYEKVKTFYEEKEAELIRNYWKEHPEEHKQFMESLDKKIEEMQKS